MHYTGQVICISKYRARLENTSAKDMLLDALGSMSQIRNTEEHEQSLPTQVKRSWVTAHPVLYDYEKYVVGIMGICGAIYR